MLITSHISLMWEFIKISRSQNSEMSPRYCLLCSCGLRGFSSEEISWKGGRLMTEGSPLAFLCSFLHFVCLIFSSTCGTPRICVLRAQRLGQRQKTAGFQRRALKDRKVQSTMKQKVNEQIELVESTKSRSCYQKGGSSEGGHF